MRKSVRIALNQSNLCVGSISSNIDNMKSGILMAQEMQADIVVFPELSITGYAPDDLLLKRNFVRENISAITEIVEFASRKVPVLIFGCVGIDDRRFNGAVVASEGNIISQCGKASLEVKGLFDEKKYFSGISKIDIFEIKNFRFGISIGGDIFKDSVMENEFRENGVGLVIDIASPVYETGILDKPYQDMESLSRRTGMCICQCNNVGGEDELIFTGGSVVIDSNGLLVSSGKVFEEDFLISDLIPKFPYEIKRIPSYEKNKYICEDVIKIDLPEEPKREIYPKIAEMPSGTEEEIILAIKMSIKDYVRKNGFKGVLIGLSGGIDSALVAALCVMAVGRENVLGIMMPSKYSSEGSVKDSEKLAENLGIRTYKTGINEVFEKYLEILGPVFSDFVPGNGKDTTEENIQARIRGNYLMAFSNKLGYLVMNTGNKSECATGYSTLYGDTVGGFAPISDLYKKWVYGISAKINQMEGQDLIPVEIIEKEPSAELSYGQKDSDSLPEYEVLDEILYRLIELDMDVDEVVACGYEEETVKKTNRLLRINEYKRRQEPLGPKISTCKFGIDRIYPITNGYGR